MSCFHLSSNEIRNFDAQSATQTPIRTQGKFLSEMAGINLLLNSTGCPSGPVEGCDKVTPGIDKVIPCSSNTVQYTEKATVSQVT